MLVERVLMPVSWLESWTVLGDDGGPFEPVERYLAYLTDIERSPNTIKAYAHDLKDWLVFLDQRALDWRGVRVGGPRGVVAGGTVAAFGRGGTGGSSGWRTSAISSRGYGCRHRAGTAGSRCCPQPVTIAGRPRSTGSFPRSAAFVSSMPGMASTWATWSPNSSRSGSGARDGNRSSTISAGPSPNGAARSS